MKACGQAMRKKHLLNPRAPLNLTHEPCFWFFFGNPGIPPTKRIFAADPFVGILLQLCAIFLGTGGVSILIASNRVKIVADYRNLPDHFERSKKGLFLQFSHDFRNTFLLKLVPNFSLGASGLPFGSHSDEKVFPHFNEKNERFWLVCSPDAAARSFTFIMEQQKRSSGKLGVSSLENVRVSKKRKRKKNYLGGGDQIVNNLHGKFGQNVSGVDGKNSNSLSDPCADARNENERTRGHALMSLFIDVYCFFFLCVILFSPSISERISKTKARFPTTKKSDSSKNPVLLEKGDLPRLKSRVNSISDSMASVEAKATVMDTSLQEEKTAVARHPKDSTQGNSDSPSLTRAGACAKDRNSSSGGKRNSRGTKMVLSATKNTTTNGCKRLTEATAKTPPDFRKRRRDQPRSNGAIAKTQPLFKKKVYFYESSSTRNGSSSSSSSSSTSKSKAKRKATFVKRNTPRSTRAKPKETMHVNLISDDDEEGGGDEEITNAKEEWSAIRPRRSSRLRKATTLPIDTSVVVDYKPKGEGERSVNIIAADLERLRPGEYLNDSLIDFYLNTFFFTKLKNNAKDLPKIRYAKAEHWTLMVVCRPDKIEGILEQKRRSKERGGRRAAAPSSTTATTKPIILYFDSLRGGYQRPHSMLIREYLTEAYKEKLLRDHQMDASSDVAATATATATATAAATSTEEKDSSATEEDSDKRKQSSSSWFPQQDNTCDCGVYVLHYAELYSMKPFEDFLTNRNDWFKKGEIAKKRKDILQLINDLSGKGVNDDQTKNESKSGLSLKDDDTKEEEEADEGLPSSLSSSSMSASVLGQGEIPTTTVRTKKRGEVKEDCQKVVAVPPSSDADDDDRIDDDNNDHGGGGGDRSSTGSSSKRGRGVRRQDILNSPALDGSCKEEEEEEEDFMNMAQIERKRSQRQQLQTNHAKRGIGARYEGKGTRETKSGTRTRIGSVVYVRDGAVEREDNGGGGGGGGGGEGGGGGGGGGAGVGVGARREFTRPNGDGVVKSVTSNSTTKSPKRRATRSSTCHAANSIEAVSLLEEESPKERIELQSSEQCSETEVDEESSRDDENDENVQNNQLSKQEPISLD
eukprot:jgi/Bigna1/128747/aug1.7_g3455